MVKPLSVAYLTSAFARPSDTFIRHEVNQLRALGLEVHTFSIRRSEVGESADADVRAHQRSTEYLLDTGALGWITSACKMILRRPLRTVRAARLACRTRAPGLRGGLRQLAYLAEALRLADRLEVLHCKHLHNHIGENSATVAMLAAEITGLPYSLTIHGPGIFTSPVQWALGEKLNRAAFTACITDFCRSQCMIYSAPDAWARLHVVRCAVAESFLGPVESHAKTEPPLLVCVGRLCAEKAQRLLVEAAQQLADEGLRFRLVLIGDGPDRPALAAMIAQRKLADTISILGWRSSREIAELLGQAHALVSASFAEGLPIVIMEALALECPVVATDIAAIGELVETGATGWLIPPARVDLLAEAMRSALTATSEERQRLGEQGRRRVLERHHPVKQADRLAELIRAASA